MKKLVIRIVLAVVIGLVTLELALQIASLVVAMTHSRETIAAGDGDGHTILCVGDSFTFGIGASSPETNYPARVADLLEQRLDHRPNVVNAGWPGQNSRDVLERLDKQLAEFEPDFVVILIGMNDLWTRPKLLELGAPEETATAAAADSGDHAWKLRWRTGRLLALIFRGGDPSFEVDHPVETDQSKVPDSARSGTDDHHDPPADESAYDAGIRLLGGGDARAALEEFLRARDEEPERAEIRQALVHTYTVLGRSNDARRELEGLAQRHATQPSQEVAQAYGVSLAIVGDTSGSYEVALAGVEDYPTSSTLWWLIGEEHFRRARMAEAERAYENALEHADPEDRPWRAALLRACAKSCPHTDPHKSFRMILESLFLDESYTPCLVALEHGQQYFTSEVFEAVIADMNFEGDQEELATRLLTSWAPNIDAADRYADQIATLELHLRQIVQRCDGAGARAVILTYPRIVPGVDAMLRRVARDMDTGFGDVTGRFDVALRTRSKQELFVPDGHPADGGFAIMAEVAADALVEALGEAKSR